MLLGSFCKFSSINLMKNKMATPLGIKVFFCNKETMLQCNGKSVEPITVETLVIHFDQEKFEELLSGDGPTLHAQKHRRVSNVRLIRMISVSIV